jgi:hypothetical protein
MLGYELCSPASSVIKACAASIAHCTWQESGYSDEEDACAILTTYCFKKLAILSLREVAVLLRNRVNQNWDW